MGRPLSPDQARAFYDRFGRAQDTQAFYENRALDDLVTHGAFESARSILEFGSGTGRLAHRLLCGVLPGDAHYLGLDVSKSMVEIARQRLAPFGERAQVQEADGRPVLNVSDGSVDRVVSTYVLDLLDEEDIRMLLGEARRVLAPGGKLCLASLTYGRGVASRVVVAAWRTVWAVRPQLLGGCRPIRLRELVTEPEWTVEHQAVHVAWGIPSEVLVARR